MNANRKQEKLIIKEKPAVSRIKQETEVLQRKDLPGERSNKSKHGN